MLLSKHVRLGCFILCAASIIKSAHAQVSFPDTAPQRGFPVLSAFAFDKLEAINKASGALVYTVPLTSMPLGRGGMSLPISLVYNSSQYDYQYSYVNATSPPYSPSVKQQLAGDNFGGWTVTPFYQIYVETKPLTPNNGGGCNVSNGIYRSSLVTPDGTRHVLYFEGFPQGFTGGDGYFPWDISGTSGCVTYSNLTGVQRLFTADGSYIRVAYSSDSGYTTVTLTDGTTIMWPNQDGVPQVITDHNGNKITVDNSAATNYQTVAKDDLGRTITFSYSTDGTSTVSQTGYGGSSLTWTFKPDPASTSTAFQFSYSCVPSQGTICTATGYGGSADILQVPSNDSAKPLVYRFHYGLKSGVLDSVTLPSGAVTTYSRDCNDYTACFQSHSNLFNPITSKQVTWVDQVDGANATRTENWSYLYGSQGNHFFCKITKPDNGIETTYLAGPSDSKALKIVQPSGDSTDYFYQANQPYGAKVSFPNPYIAAEVHNVAQSGTANLSAVTRYLIDKNGNDVNATAYNWVAYNSLSRDSNGILNALPSGSAVLKQNQNTYTAPTYTAGDGSETVSENTNGYWNGAAPTLLHLLQSASVTGGANSSLTGYQYSAQGNPTQRAEWDSTLGSQPTASSLSRSNARVNNWSWDGYGNLIQATDPNNVVTKYTFDSNSLYLATKVQAYGAAVARTFNYGWDNNLGLLTSITDLDNATATTYTYDWMGRQTGTTEGGGQLTRQTQTTYNDATRTVTVNKDQWSTGDRQLTSVTGYDQLYRPALVQQSEGSGSWIKTQTRYVDSPSGNYKLVSNPYRAATASAANSESTMGWTLTTYDQNGRTASSQSFIGSGLPSAFGGNNTVTTGTASYTYAQNSTVTTDQAGHQRATFTDGLGRLALVGEYPGSGSYSTSYSYDALDNLTGVSQSSETRTFVYDSLKRLIAATNPETFSSANPAALGCSSGNAPYANCYYYDSNGNLTKKTDNRGLGVAYSYDALNRVQSKSYFNVPLTTNYVAATYTYDQASVSYSKGRLTSATTTTGETSATNYLGYDALGRVLASSQTTNGNTYQFGYTYNFADALTSETYPSGRIVNTCMDGANRAFQVSVSQCGDASFAYASNVKYAVHGAPIQVVMGNNLWHNPVYNSRLQMSSFQDLLNNNANVTLWSGNLNWGSSNNNGNLVGATYNAGGPGYSQLLTFNQAFTYDGLNRLTAANETGGWSRSFAYDAYGNMTPSGTPAPPTVSFNGNNQIVGQQYDQAGNVLAANGNKLGYDFEGRITSEQDGQNQAVETYVFDADGKRVQKYGPSGTARIVYAYDAMGRMAAEYSTVAEVPSCITCYLSADHLGTTRLITDQNGLVVARHDFLPFGEEVQGNTFGRDSHWGSGNDSINQKFTGKERDSESGLDYFGARYYGSALGRFTSPDEPLIDQHAINPQSWNLYGYARNNSLSYLDPTGNCSVKAGSAATDDPGSPCVTPGDTSVTVTAQAPDPDEERVTQLVTLTAGALDTQLRETRNIAISAYLGEAAGFGIGKFVLGPIFTRLAAQRALQAATAATTGARAGRTWIAAYDVETGAVAVGHSGPLPNPADLDPGLLSAMDNAGGLGARNAGVAQPVGCCGEVNAANQLLQKGSKLENIRFTDAVRPRTGEVIPRCANCQATFGK